MIKQSKGITLVALVITIIILLILAGITIAQLTGNGFFEKAKLAKEKSENAQIEENTILGDYESKIDNIVGSREITEEQYNYLLGEINNMKIISKEFTATTSSGWMKVSDYPNGYTMNNCIVYGCIYDGQNLRFFPFYSVDSTKILLENRTDGIYVYIGSYYVNQKGKIFIQRI